MKLKLTTYDPLFRELFDKIANGKFSCRIALLKGRRFQEADLVYLLDACVRRCGNDYDWRANYLRKVLGIPYYNSARYLAEAL